MGVLLAADVIEGASVPLQRLEGGVDHGRFSHQLAILGWQNGGIRTRVEASSLDLQPIASGTGVGGPVRGTTGREVGYALETEARRGLGNRDERDLAASVASVVY
jgi:hypothetical protein